MSINTISHNGIDILNIDYTQTQNLQEMLVILNDAAEYMRNSPVALRTLSDFSGLSVNGTFLQRAKSLGKEVFQAKTDKGALVGLNASMKIMLNAYNNFTQNNLVAFDTRAEALIYLTSV